MMREWHHGAADAPRAPEPILSKLPSLAVFIRPGQSTLNVLPFCLLEIRERLESTAVDQISIETFET